MEEKVEKKSGLCTAGLVLGIVGVCTSFIPIINNLSFVMGLLAIIFGLISLKKASLAKWIITVILGVLAIWFTISSQQALSESLNEALEDFSGDMNKISEEFNNSMGDLNGDNTESILANDIDVQIGKFEVVKDDYWDNTKLTVTITNKTSEIKSFSVMIEAIDTDGNRITQETAYANSLNPGQSYSDDLFTFISSDEIEKLKTATFNIVKVSKY